MLGVVNAEGAKDARTVIVELLHDAQHPSALIVPIAAERSAAVAADKR